MVYPIGRLFRPVVTFPVKDVEGIENLPKEGAFVVASNHTSFIDPLILACIISKHLKKQKIYFVSAMFLFFDLLVNLILGEFGGSIRLKKKVHGGFLKSSLKRLKKGNIIAMFPEGVPNKKPDLRKGKTGVARVVLNGRVPVIPIGIQGTINIWSRIKWIPRPRKRVIIKIGKPLFFNQYYGKENDYSALKKVTTVIMKNIASLTDQDYNF